MRFSCDYGMKGGASSFLGNWCYKKPGQGKSHTWRSCCSFFGDRFGGRNDNLRLSWGFHLDHIGGGLVGVMWIHGIPANSLLLSTHRPVTTLEWGETSCVLFVKKRNFLRWGMMMKSFALFTFFCFSVLLSGWSGCTDFECTIFPRDFDVSSFSLFLFSTPTLIMTDLKIHAGKIEKEGKMTAQSVIQYSCTWGSSK